MRIKVIEPPALEPMTIEEAKKIMGITGGYDDDEMVSLLAQARQDCEHYQRRRFITQTLDVYLDKFPSSSVLELIDCSPVQSITHIKYTDYNGVTAEFPSTSYVLDNVSEVNRLVLSRNCSWPSVELAPVNGVVIRLIAGVDAEKVGNRIVSSLPEAIKWAIELQMRIVYDNPPNREDLMKARNQLLKPKRVMLI